MITVNKLVPFDFDDISPDMVFRPIPSVANKWGIMYPSYLRPVHVGLMGLSFVVCEMGDISFWVDYQELREQYEASIDGKVWHKCEKVSNSSS